MRTDYTLDDVCVIAPNATLIGFATRTVKRGSFFTYTHVGSNGAKSDAMMARSLGRLRATEEPGKGPVRVYVLAMVLSDNGRHCFARWVDPADITECYKDAPTDLAAFFFAPQLPYDPSTMLQLLDHDTVADQFVAQHAERVAMFEERWDKADAKAMADSLCRQYARNVDGRLVHDRSAAVRHAEDKISRTTSKAERRYWTRVIRELRKR